MDYKERNVTWAAGLLIGPYGLAMVAAGKEHQEKQRKLFARDMHMRCSSQPLPNNLEIQATTKKMQFPKIARDRSGLFDASVPCSASPNPASQVHGILSTAG